MENSIWWDQSLKLFMLEIIFRMAGHPKVKIIIWLFHLMVTLHFRIEKGFPWAKLKATPSFNLTSFFTKVKICFLIWTFQQIKRILLFCFLELLQSSRKCVKIILLSTSVGEKKFQQNKFEKIKCIFCELSGKFGTEEKVFSQSCLQNDDLFRINKHQLGYC